MHWTPPPKRTSPALLSSTTRRWPACCPKLHPLYRRTVQGVAAQGRRDSRQRGLPRVRAHLHVLPVPDLCYWRSVSREASRLSIVMV